MSPRDTLEEREAQMPFKTPASRVAVRQRARCMKLLAPVTGAIATVLVIAAPAAQGATKWADIRVVTSDGSQLADHRQYTDAVKVRTSEDATCFGESNPSSDETYSLDSPTALGTLVDAAKFDDDLDPLLITDAFFGEFGSFGVCGIGPFVGSDVFGEEYWYNANNGVGATTGPNLIPTAKGDRQLWYFATGAESSIAELVLKGPARVVAGEPFEVTVTRINPNGSKEPAEGVSVTGDIEPTDADGKTDVIVNEQGNTRLYAGGGPDDVLSAGLFVCAANDLTSCPRRRGKRIFGTHKDDEMKGTKGPDAINCGKGRDIVREAQKSDSISGNCEKVKRA